MSVRTGIALLAILMAAAGAVAQTEQGATGKATASVPQPQPLEPAANGEPHTEMTPATAASRDPLLDPPPLPDSSLSLLGGVVRKVDTIHNRLTLAPFGGGKSYQLSFDERTRILADGRESTALAIHPGDRIHVDTQPLGAQVFARTIQVSRQSGTAEASGQVVEFLSGRLRVEDRLSGRTLECSVTGRTRIERHGQVVAASQLHSGALVTVTFVPGVKGGEAASVRIDASPGDAYTFTGVLTNVNLSEGVLAVDNQADGGNYEIFFDPLASASLEKLTAGTPVTIAASFDGKHYRANSIQVTNTDTER